MSPRLGTYSFLPWLRQGLANEIRPGSIPPGSTRATINVTLLVKGTGGSSPLIETITRPVPLYGPGDVIGVDRRGIVHTDPRDRATNFEPNYLPHIEFYDEDFPWRYSPEPAAGHRLQPWLALVVLKEDEFTDVARTRERPLPFIEVDAPDSVFQPADQLWAWAHVHVNRDLGATEEQIVTTDMNAVMSKLESTLRSNSDLGYSRLLCPRRLDVSMTYHAFVIPAYESGRRAGLGIDPTGMPATQIAWGAAPGPEPSHFPYYHRWSFITATRGDFEYLVRLLEPRPVDNRVGRRDIDVQEPGSNLRGITDPVAGVLRLGGALRVPLDTMSNEERAEYDLYNEWDRANYPTNFQRDLAAFINLADDYSTKPAETANADSEYDATIADPDHPGGRQTDPDPLITPPLYGRWHAVTERLLVQRDGTPVQHDDRWVHQLNLDPRSRVAAGYGTQVIQRNQEEYMEAAWEQVGDVLAANDRIRTGQFSKLVAQTWYVRTLVPLSAHTAHREHALALVAPVQARVVSDDVTVHQQIRQSTLPRALLTPQARRILRPEGRLMRLSPFDEKHPPGNLLERTNAGEVTANPPKGPLTGVPTLEDIAIAAAEVAGADVPPLVRTLLTRFPWLVTAVLMLAIVLLILSGGLLLPLSVFLFWLYRRLRQWHDAMQPPDGLREDTRTPAAVNELPKSPDFRLIVNLDDAFRPSTNGADSSEASRYKQALRDAYSLAEAGRAASAVLRPVRKPLDLGRTVHTLVRAVEPAVTIPRHIHAGITIPGRLRDQQTGDFDEVKAYPVIDVPMYKPLVELSEENLLPNLGLIEQNTISLLETNRRFIEAYMVGINHEWSRELLWRAYPSDLRGSTFRQFWDAAGYLDDRHLGDDEQRERQRDIPPLHRWTLPSELGSHNNRQTSGPVREDLVLIIRGELLKRYPNAVIYAHRARWQMRGGEIARDLPRELDDPGVAEDENPPRDKVRTPLYEARIDPDITFFGFDLDVEEALGDPDANDENRPGWYFVIKERPGEPRFGLDLGGGETLHTWNDVGWENVAPGIQPGDMLQITSASPEITLATPPASTPENLRAQAQDDRALRWHAGMDAAELAYILYQVPVLVAVHAAEMLPKREED